MVANSFSTGGGGVHFEAHVQAVFVILMFTGGKIPCLPYWPTIKIKLQGKAEGYQIDDLIVFVQHEHTNEKRKLLAEIKRSIHFTKKDRTLSKVIKAAWDDFNNPKQHEQHEPFVRGKDAIALITGPLNDTDNRTIPWLLDQARSTENMGEFYRRVKQENFSPNKSDEKLKVIEHHINECSDKKISEEELYEFIKHFYLLRFDMGTEDGIFLSLVLSRVSQLSQDEENVWSRVVNMVQIKNRSAGTITPDHIPEDLKEDFKPRDTISIPDKLSPVSGEKRESDIALSQYPYLNELALANLIGAWDTSNQKDISTLHSFLSQVNQEYNTWILRIEEIFPQLESFISLNGEQWEIKERGNLWKKLGSRIHSKHLNALKDIAIEVFTERNPYFGFSSVRRSIDIARNKEIVTISSGLRRGLANSLAFLGSRPRTLRRCSQDTVKDTVDLCVYEIFSGINAEDAVLWGSLNELLPSLAEAAPERFLSAVEQALQADTSPFDELFNREGDFITSQNYMTGLLSALEGLAWDEQFLVQVCVILGELASRDPGGASTNQPADSLTTILLPWYPQTIAPIEKRKVAVEILLKEASEVAWKLIISLLPGQTRFTRDSYKLLWRNSLKTKAKKSTSTEYQKQILCYSDLAVDAARNNASRLLELTSYLDILPKPALEKLLMVLDSNEMSKFSEDERSLIWGNLKMKSLENHRLSRLKQNFDRELLISIDRLEHKLRPAHPFNLHRRLFTANSASLYEDKEAREKQEEKLNEKKKQAVKEIWEIGGIDMIIKLSEQVKFPEQVGWFLGYISSEKIDDALFPRCLKSDNSQNSIFIQRYIMNVHRTKGWPWVDDLDRADWCDEQTAEFLAFLPFENETWKRAKKWLKNMESIYWKKTNAWQYSDSGDWKPAVDKLIKYGRPRAAIICLSKMLNDGKSIDVPLCVRALMSAVNSSEHIYQDDQWETKCVIENLQESHEITPDDICNIEFAYLKLLTHYDDTFPKRLEKRLAEQPDFFCKLICLIYRPKNSTDKSERDRATAERAFQLYQLLEEWKYPPGKMEDGGFDSAQLLKWLKVVREKCTDSDRLEVALLHAGEVLIHCPKDTDGFWIDRGVAEILDAKDAKEMRVGFYSGLRSSRGAHLVDPTAEPERKLATKYRQQAKETENDGYSRLATALRELANSYDREAERIINESRNEM